MPGVELAQNLKMCDPPPPANMRCLLHLDALAVDMERLDAAAAIEDPISNDRMVRYEHGMRVSEALSGVAQLTPRNFHLTAKLDDLARGGLRLFEVANEAWDSNDEGDKAHPSTNAMWDYVPGARGSIVSDGHR